MVEDSGLNIFLNVVGNDTFVKNTNYFLYGWETVSQNGNKTVFIESIYPTTLNINVTKYAAHINGRLYKYDDDQKILVGLRIGDIRTCDNTLVDYVVSIFKTSIFHLIMSSHGSGSYQNSVLIIPKFSTQNSEYTVLGEDWSYDKIFVISLDKNITLPLKNIPCLSRLDVKQVNEYCRRFGPLQCPSSPGSASRSPVTRLFHLLLFSVFWFIKCAIDPVNASTIYNVLQYSGNFLYVTQQILYRLNQISKMVSHIKEPAMSNKRSVNYGAQVLLVTIDIILGLIVVNLLLSSKDFLFISTWLVGQKYIVAEYLQNLLNWLMGVPVGLKLNKPLNQFLGHFYIYHVHLWTSYLYFIEAYLPNIVWLCSLSGCFGITFLLSVVCDVLSLLTMHIYCFYIYAARLYKFEIHALVSLLRLFTGKKWNILRNRVDSLEYDVDRLFIGTLLFTILLFLFPTIFLYYIVFTTLRLVVLSIQAVLIGVVAVFNTFPFWGLWLFFVKPEYLPGQLVLDVNTTDKKDSSVSLDGDQNIRFIKPDSVMFLFIRHQCQPIRNLFSNCVTAVIEGTYYGIFGGGIFKKFLNGQLYGSNQNSTIDTCRKL